MTDKIRFVVLGVALFILGASIQHVATVPDPDQIGFGLVGIVVSGILMGVCLLIKPPIKQEEKN